MKPTEQQKAIIDAVATGEHTKAQAFAGTGKTTTLNFVSNYALGSARVLYLAFNRSTKDEAIEKFPRHVTCKTWHGLAYPKAVQMGFNKGRKASLMVIARELETDPLIAPLLPLTNGEERPAAFAIAQTLGRFCQSDKPAIGPEHVPPMLLVRLPDQKTKSQAAKLTAEASQKVWDQRVMPRGSSFPMTFDYYLKAWVLDGRNLPFDTVLLDESQDSNPVTLTYLMAQTCQQVYVGDSHQQIYEWRGAVDAMKKAPGESLPLTESWRFGPELAEKANLILKMLGEELPLVGIGPPTQVVDDPQLPMNHGAILCRGNAGVVEETIIALDKGRRVAVVGGTDEAVKLLQAAYTLFCRRRPNHPELGIFDSWSEFYDFTETEEGGSYRPIVRMVLSYREEIPRLCDRLRYDTEQREERAEIVVSTAHKAKGREWANVRFSDDFGELVDPPEKPGEKPHLNREEARLAYVSITRAKEHLNLGGYGAQLAADIARFEGKTV